MANPDEIELGGRGGEEFFSTLRRRSLMRWRRHFVPLHLVGLVVCAPVLAAPWLVRVDPRAGASLLAGYIHFPAGVWVTFAEMFGDRPSGPSGVILLILIASPAAWSVATAVLAAGLHAAETRRQFFRFSLPPSSTVRVALLGLLAIWFYSMAGALFFGVAGLFSGLFLDTLGEAGVGVAAVGWYVFVVWVGTRSWLILPLIAVDGMTLKGALESRARPSRGTSIAVLGCLALVLVLQALVTAAAYGFEPLRWPTLSLAAVLGTTLSACVLTEARAMVWDGQHPVVREIGEVFE